MVAGDAWYVVGCSSWLSMLMLAGGAGGVQYLVGCRSWWGKVAGGAR